MIKNYGLQQEGILNKNQKARDPYYLLQYTITYSYTAPNKALCLGLLF
ncbi:hypothetical protein CLERM_009 [Coxiella-like endosymbiont]|nr:hypothetical protein CLERM_009 [Coxiella-like endosymbiont]